jgi:hypothetical protein
VNKIPKLLSCCSSVFLILFFCSCVFASPQESYPPNWKLNLKWEDIPLSEVNLPYEEIDLKGGKLDLSFTINRQREGGVYYEGQGNISDGVVYLSHWEDEIRNIESEFTLKGGNIEIVSCKGIFRDAPLTATGKISLDPPYMFEAEISAQDVTIDDVSPIFPFIKPRIGLYKTIETKGEMNFMVDGTLPEGPFQGRVVLPAASFYSILMDNVEISFVYRDKEIVLENFSVNVSEGSISGEGEIIIKQKSSK